MRFYLLYASFLLLLLAGCHKPEEGYTTAEGWVKDEATGQVVAGATVQLLRTAEGGGLTGTYPRGGISATTDAYGYFWLSFEAGEGDFYELEGAAPGFLSGSLSMQPTVRIWGGRNNKVEVPLRPEGYVRVRFLSPAPAPYAKVQYVRMDGLPLYVMADRNGSPIDTTIAMANVGGRDNTLSWWVYPDGTSTSSRHEATVYVPAHDTIDYTIRF